MGFEPAEVFWIEDGETFELLADSTRLEILELTMVPRSVTEIAEAMRVPRTRLYHHVRLLEESGLIAVASTRQAGAMTEKVYQAAALSYQPGKAFLESAAPRQQADAVLASLFNTTRADFLRALEDRAFGLEDQPGARRVSLARRLLRLRPERLAQMIDELEELFERFDDPDDGDDVVTVAALQVIHPSSRHLP